MESSFECAGDMYFKLNGRGDYAVGGRVVLSRPIEGCVLISAEEYSQKHVLRGGTTEFDFTLEIPTLDRVDIEVCPLDEDAFTCTVMLNTMSAVQDFTTVIEHE